MLASCSRIRDPPTALFTAQQLDHGRRAAGLPRPRPDDAVPALVGFDDLDLGDLLGVSVIQHDPEEMGRLAAQTACARFDGDDGPCATRVVPTTLVARGSGERPSDAVTSLPLADRWSAIDRQHQVTG